MGQRQTRSGTLRTWVSTAPRIYSLGALSTGSRAGGTSTGGPAAGGASSSLCRSDVERRTVRRIERPGSRGYCAGTATASEAAEPSGSANRYVFTGTTLKVTDVTPCATGVVAKYAWA